MQSGSLILAPHLTYPLRNGGDLLIDRKWSMFSKHVGSVDILGMNVLRRYNSGKLISEVSFSNQNRNKKVAAFRSIIKNSHYLLEKYMTPEYISEASNILFNGQYDLLVFSLITTAWPFTQMGLKLPDKLVIETQNDEIKWYRNIRIQSNNIPEKISALISEQWLRNNLHKLENHLFIHVSEEDDSGYRKVLPNHNSIVIPVGTDEEPLLSFKSTTDINCDSFALIFAGSLTTKINYDALKHFEKRFYPYIKDKFCNRIRVIVAGSNPSNDIRILCKKNSWVLHENVSDDKLHDLYQQSLFSILPFSYVNGGKLKLLKSLSLGIPFLASTPLSCQLNSIPFPCLISDEPEEWIRHIESALNQGIGAVNRAELIEIAKQYSWSRLAESMFDKFVLHFSSK
ncbi:MAG: glycosyltransferase [Geobacter sp.]|nr:glycosyltransferase [Geobacter sp.]